MNMTEQEATNGGGNHLHGLAQRMNPRGSSDLGISQAHSEAAVVAEMATQALIVETDGKLWSRVPFEPIGAKRIPSVLVASLTAFVEYIRSDIDSLDYRRVAILIASPTHVFLFTKAHDGTNHRDFPVVAEYGVEVSPGGKITPPGIGVIVAEPLDFVRVLRTQFQQDTSVKELIDFCSVIDVSENQKVETAGMQQSISITKTVGGALRSRERVPEEVRLRPYWTFEEIETPQLPYLFTVAAACGPAKDSPKIISLTLRPISDPKPALEARNAIRAYLQQRLSELALPTIPILS